MADRENARPDFNPKHRIVGAIIIVAIMVIVVPMILNERQPASEAVKDISETSVGGETASTKIVVAPVAGEESQVKPAAESAVEVTPGPPPPPAPIVASAPKPETKPAAPVEKPSPVKKPKAAPIEKITKGWIVQVGTFSNTDNAVRLRAKLKSHGHAVRTEIVRVAGKKAMRLRVGPFHDKEYAVRAQTQIRKETGVSGAVLSYP
ncbi:MAG: SPOR domain-containing protein [Sulfuricaulis sp.]